MPDVGDSDPIERYFRPRPESPTGPEEGTVPERPGEG